MLKSIRLINYKSHPDTVIEFNDPITWIIGRNQAGKSNIIKAMDTLLYMGDFPDKHIKTGCKEASIEATWEDGRTIKRTRTKAGQSITLTYADGTVKEYGSTSNLKEIVTEFTRFKAVPLDINSTPEKIQISHLNQVMFMMYGISAEGILRRVAAAISGTGIETAKANLERDLRHYETTVKEQEAVVKSIKYFLDRINYKVIEEMVDKINTMDVMCRGVKQVVDFQEKASKVAGDLKLLNKGKSLRDWNITTKLEEIASKMDVQDTIAEYQNLVEEKGNIAIELMQIKEELNNIPLCDKCGQVIA